MLRSPIEVLLIEDNQADVELTKEAFAQNKIFVHLHVTSTGEEGLQFLSRTGHFSGVVRPDLILLDLNLPGMDGREVLRKIKNNHDFCQIPVIILTTSDADLDILKSYSIGANCYIVKPVDFEKFLEVVFQIQDFWFSLVKLPRHELVEKYQVITGQSGPMTNQNNEPTRPIEVLYIEDSDADADLVFESLSSLLEPRFTSHRAVRLADAFKYLETHSIDVVLLDLSLPDSQGFETVLNLLARAPNLPIIVLTGTDDKALGVQAVQKGAQDYLVKGQVDGEFLGRIIIYAIERKTNLLIQTALLESVSVARDEAFKAIEIRDEFLSIASHELRTPLTSLKLQIQLITRMMRKMGGTKSDFLNMAERMEERIQHFCQLVETLLDFSRIQSGRLKLEYSHFDINEIIKESVESLTPEFKKMGSEVTLNLGQSVSGEWDRHRLEQVLVNLLSNGMKYAGGKPLEVSVSCDGTNVSIRFKDQGPGIAAQDKERIFQRFERIAGTRSISGLGLGLYVVRQIIDAHGGRIFVESELGVGSTFVIHLPRKPMGAFSPLLSDSTSPRNEK